MRRYYVVALLLLFIAVQSTAQSRQEPGTTYWVGAEDDGSSFVLELSSSGRVKFIPATGVISSGRWKRKENRIEMDLNGKFIRLTGVLEGERIEGTAETKRGDRSNWIARQQPRVLSTAAPVYPPLARAARISGVVQVDVRVDSTGAVASANSLAGHPLLRTVAEKAAREYRFEPDARSETRRARLTFLFRLVDVPHERVAAPIILSPYHIEVRGGLGRVETSYARVTNKLRIRS